LESSSSHRIEYPPLTEISPNPSSIRRNYMLRGSGSENINFAAPYKSAHSIFIACPATTNKHSISSSFFGAHAISPDTVRLGERAVEGPSMRVCSGGNNLANMITMSAILSTRTQKKISLFPSICIYWRLFITSDIQVRFEPEYRRAGFMCRIVQTQMGD
jgi:hypothetical protein